MKIAYDILVFVCVCLIMGCAVETAGSNDPPNYKVRTENHMGGYDYPKGVYYEYRFSSYTDKIANIDEELGKLHKKGISVLDAWYLSGSAMCVPPDGKKGMNVIVKPRFIVRLKEINSDILLHNYTYIETPTKIFCGYRVERYHR